MIREAAQGLLGLRLLAVHQCADKRLRFRGIKSERLQRMFDLRRQLRVHNKQRSPLAANLGNLRETGFVCELAPSLFQAGVGLVA